MSTIILASHGTDNPIGAASIHQLVEAVRAALPEHQILEAFVDVQVPQVAEVLNQALTEWPEEPVIIVPLLLSTGYHVRKDITDAVAESAAPDRVSVTPALGPSPELVELLADRLQQVGWRGTDLTILSVAGSSDQSAVEECRQVHAELQSALRRIEVTNKLELAFLSAAEPKLKDLIPRLKFQNPRARFTVANYLLASGFFNDLTNRAGANLVAEPLLSAEGSVPQQLIDVVIRRVREADAGGVVGCLKAKNPNWSCAAGCSTPCR